MPTARIPSRTDWTKAKSSAEKKLGKAGQFPVAEEKINLGPTLEKANTGSFAKLMEAQAQVIKAKDAFEKALKSAQADAKKLAAASKKYRDLINKDNFGLDASTQGSTITQVRKILSDVLDQIDQGLQGVQQMRVP